MQNIPVNCNYSSVTGLGTFSRLPTKSYWNSVLLAEVCKLFILYVCMIISEYHNFVLLKIEPMRIRLSLRLERAIPKNTRQIAYAL